MNSSIVRWSALVAAGSALALGAAPPAGYASGLTKRPETAQAQAALAGLRLYKTLSFRGRAVELLGLDVVGAADAWVAGVTTTGEYAMPRAIIEHWDGRAWNAVPLPTAVAKVAAAEPFGAIGASSGKNVWAFDVTGSYAHLSGTRWTVGRLPIGRTGHVYISAATVFGRSAAWAFGTRITGGGSQHPRFTPYAARFDGSRWRATAVPGNGPFVASAVSADDVWAVAGALPPGTRFDTASVIVHWNGTAWRRVPAQPQPPEHATLSSIVALSDTDVWVGGSAPNGQSGTSEYAAHWDGASWTTASPPAAASRLDFYLAELAPDGAGGFWGVGDQGFPGSWRLWHYSSGTWSGPAAGHPRWILLQLAAIRGTKSIWAIGLTASLTKGLILLHGPVPRRAAAG